MEAPRPPLACCSVCGTSFAPRVSYQVEKRLDGSVRAYCSLPCKAGGAKSDVQCGTCGKLFTLTFAYQAHRTSTGAIEYVCSEACRSSRPSLARLPAAAPNLAKPPRRLAVLNQKGGTGKTTTSINLAAAIAEEGQRVLLVDADPQGNVGISLGVKSAHTLYHVLMDEVSVDDATVPIGETFDVLTSDDNLAAAEIKLAQHPARGAVLKKRLERSSRPYDYVIIDCGPSLSLINQNALCYVDEVVVPVACDYLSLIGVKQVLKTVKNINQHLGHPLRIGAIVPTFFDVRAKICRDALDALQKHFGELCAPPVRINTKLKEAPSHKKTIFEHDPSSTGAEDYRVVVKHIVSRPKASPARDEQPREVERERARTVPAAIEFADARSRS